MRAALASAPGLHPADFRVVASESTLAVKARQVGTTAQAETYAVHGVDAPFLQNTTYQFSAKAQRLRNVRGGLARAAHAARAGRR